MKRVAMSMCGLAMFLTSVTSGTAQEAKTEKPQLTPLWADGAPGAKCKDAADVPGIMVYLPEKDKANGAAVVICPGGGYGFLAMDHEGDQIAEWLNKNGVAGIVLKYRLGPKYN